nr:helix-turn-helix transcriptional regulator [Comamonas koreensis]
MQPELIAEILKRAETDPRGLDYRPAVPAFAVRVDVEEREREIPVHQHPMAQLVIAVRGAVSCNVPGGLWLVPPQAGVWIPGGMPHSNHSTANALIYYLMVAPDAAEHLLPQECCTLKLSPMVSEMIQHLASLQHLYESGDATDRLVRVLLEQLGMMPKEELFLPLPEDKQLRKISRAIMLDPTHRGSLQSWAQALNTSERTLNRLCTSQTGLSFGRWRRQLQMMLALRQLAEGATVQQVAFSLGYESPSAFNTTFKKTFGKPPAAYISERFRISGRTRVVV